MYGDPYGRTYVRLYVRLHLTSHISPCTDVLLATSYKKRSLWLYRDLAKHLARVSCGKRAMQRAPARPELAVRQLLAIARSVLRTEPIGDIADLSEALKVRIAQGGWHYPPRDVLTDVLLQVMRDAPLPLPPAVPVARPAPTPISHEDAVAILAQLRASVRAMPSPRPWTVRQEECRRALQIVAQAIVDQVARCEDVEQ